MPTGPQAIIFTIIAFSRGGGVSKLTINCSLIFSLFHPLIQFSREKRLNDQINQTNNDAINGMFERPYCPIQYTRQTLERCPRVQLCIKFFPLMFLFGGGRRSCFP